MNKHTIFLLIFMMSHWLNSCTFPIEQVVQEYHGNFVTDLFFQQIIGPKQWYKEENFIIQEASLQISPSLKLSLGYRYFHQGCPPSSTIAVSEVMLQPNEHMIFPDGAIITAYKNSLELRQGNEVQIVNEKTGSSTFERGENGFWQIFKPMAPMDTCL